MSVLSNDLALRIGLAAREIPDTDAGRLIHVLTDALNQPLSVKKLGSLKLSQLKLAANGEFSNVDSSLLESALSRLKEETKLTLNALPAIQPYADGDMPDSIRVACASNKDEKLDGHFGSCQRFLIYQVNSSEIRLVDIIEMDDVDNSDDKNALRASLLKGCQILFVASIGGPAAAKVVKAGVHPIKKLDAGLAIVAIQSLQLVIGDNAPPWLAKVMGQTPEQRIRFEQEAEA